LRSNLRFSSTCRDFIFSLHKQFTEDDDITSTPILSDISLSVMKHYIRDARKIDIIRQNQTEKLHNLAYYYYDRKKRTPLFWFQLDLSHLRVTRTYISSIDPRSFTTLIFTPLANYMNNVRNKITVEWMSRVQMKLDQCVHLSHVMWVVWCASGASLQCDFCCYHRKEIPRQRDKRGILNRYLVFHDS